MSPKVKSKPVRVKDFARRGKLDPRWINIIKQHGFFLQFPHANKTEFVKAFNAKKTTDYTRMIMIVSTFTRDKEFAGRKLRHKSLMNVGIAPIFDRKGKLKHFETHGIRAPGGKKSAAGLFNEPERVRTNSVDRQNIMDGRIPKGVEDTLTGILPDGKDNKTKYKLIQWLMEAIAHLANLLWTLAMALKLFDKRGVIIYPDRWHNRDRGDKDVYVQDTSTIELHGFPEHLDHYIRQDEKFTEIYWVFEATYKSIRHYHKLKDTHKLAVDINHKECETEDDAFEFINKLVVSIAVCVRYTNDLKNDLMSKARRPSRYVQRFKMSALSIEADVYRQTRHKTRNVRGRKQKNLSNDAQTLDLVDKILKGLTNFEIENGPQE